MPASKERGGLKCAVSYTTTQRMENQPPRSTLHLFLAVQFTSNSLSFVQNSRGRRSFKKRILWGGVCHSSVKGRGVVWSGQNAYIRMETRWIFCSVSACLRKKAAKGRETDLSIFPQRNKACLDRNWPVTFPRKFCEKMPQGKQSTTPILKKVFWKPILLTLFGTLSHFYLSPYRNLFVYFPHIPT